MLQPPTDNLYKFMAIFGLVIFGFSIYLPWQRHEEATREIAKWNASWGPIVERSRDLALHALDDVRCLIDAPAARNCEELSASKERRRLSAENVKTSAAELRAGKALLEHQASVSRTFAIIGTIFAAAGLLIAITGFLLWYFKLQRYQDQERAFSPRRQGRRAR